MVDFCAQKFCMPIFSTQFMLCAFEPKPITHYIDCFGHDSWENNFFIQF